MQYFEIAFCGELVPGAEREQVKAAIAALFKADAAVLARLFSGQRVVIKQRLDAQATAKYQAAFQHAGAVLDVRDLSAPVESSTVSSEAVASELEQTPQHVSVQTATAAPAMLHITPRDEYMAAFRDVQAPDFGLAALGADLQLTPIAKPASKIDVSALSLAPAGSDMGQLPSAQAMIMPDISHIKLLDID